jgi:hypothetical protein
MVARGFRGVGVHFLSMARSASATPSDDPGFCPVMSLPSSTTKDPQSAPLEYTPPCSVNVVSRRNGTTSVSPTAASCGSRGEHAWAGHRSANGCSTIGRARARACVCVCVCVCVRARVWLEHS